MLIRFLAAFSVMVAVSACGSAQPSPAAPRSDASPTSSRGLESAGASRGKSAPAPAAANTPSCPEGSTWTGDHCAGNARLEAESLGTPGPSASPDHPAEAGLQTLEHESGGSGAPARPAQAPIPADLGTGPIAGEWSEAFGGRAGCSDKIYIRQEGADLQLVGADCNDGERYAYESPHFTGNTLIVRATVPSSGYVIVYMLRQTKPGELKGKASVTGGGQTNNYDVTWTRTSAPRAAAAATSASPATPARQGIEGVWVESFASRGGCSDKIAIHQVGTTLMFSGADCNRGDPYVYSEPTFNGIVLTVKATVPSTKWVIQYTLRQTRPGELKGQAKVTGGGSTNTYDVTWTRQD